MTFDMLVAPDLAQLTDTPVDERTFALSPNGEHVLTTNIITFNNQIGVGSREIRVVR